MEEAARGVPRSVTEAVLYYYNETLPDYLVLWSKTGSRALHFAFDGPAVRSHHEGLDYANDVLANHAGITAGMRVLDAGCGLGGSAAWLALHRRAHVTGVNLVPDQIVR